MEPVLIEPQVADYGQTVDNLAKLLLEAWHSRGAPGHFAITILGHGGRDTNCGLAVAQAVANTPGLNVSSAITLCTCSWADDTWEPLMQEFSQVLSVQNGIEFNVSILKFMEEPIHTRQRIQEALEGAHVVVECEQGVDLFT